MKYTAIPAPRRALTKAVVLTMTTRSPMEMLTGVRPPVRTVVGRKAGLRVLSGLFSRWRTVFRPSRTAIDQDMNTSGRSDLFHSHVCAFDGERPFWVFRDQCFREKHWASKNIFLEEASTARHILHHILLISVSRLENIQFSCHFDALAAIRYPDTLSTVHVLFGRAR